MRSFSGRVPVCAATSFFKSPMVSSSLHLTRIFFPCDEKGERWMMVSERGGFERLGVPHVTRGETDIVYSSKCTHQSVVEHHFDHSEGKGGAREALLMMK